MDVKCSTMVPSKCIIEVHHFKNTVSQDFFSAGRESPLSSLVGLDWEDPEDIRARVRTLEQVLLGHPTTAAEVEVPRVSGLLNRNVLLMSSNS